MKKITCHIFTLILFITSYNALAQPNPVEINSFNGEFAVYDNDANHPCISPEEYALIERRCNENTRLLRINNIQNSRAITTLSWPLQATSTNTGCDYYYIAQYVDEDTNAVAFEDWNCGSTTYDGHRGTDIAIAPFPFYKMDHNEVEVIAAAPGIIVDKSDGHFDKNCTLMTDSIANYVVIQHSNGSRALYWHMKKTSITTDSIGQEVATGDYLGLVGSSGMATGPHLHFELWADSSSTSLNDPYGGPCNIFNSTSSWWAVQKPYREPAVVQVLVDSAAPISPPCPATETPNNCNIYSTGGGKGYFFVGFRDETAGMIANLSITNLDGSVYYKWNDTSIRSSVSSYAYWTLSQRPSIAGTYIFQANYNGTTCSDTFIVAEINAGIANLSSQGGLRIYPNPSTGKIFVDWQNINAGSTGSANEAPGDKMVEIYNMLGEKVFQSETQRMEIQLNLPGGMYFCQLKSKQQLIASAKFVVE